MKVFLPIDTNQTLTIIPRFESTNVKVLIRDKETDTTTTLVRTATTTDGYMDITIAYDFVEAKQYEITVTDDSDVLMYRGQCFATAQTDLENYKMNSDIIEI